MSSTPVAYFDITAQFVFVFLPCVLTVACAGLLFWCLTCPVMSYVNVIGVVFIVVLLVVGVIVVLLVVGWM